MTTPHWGPHFPDAAGGHFWGPHFPDGVPNPLVIPPTGPATAATFVIALSAGTKLTYSWPADVQKMYSGKEYRAQPADDPKQSYQGTALLLEDSTRAMRARLARFAAIGGAFSLGLPFEGLSVAGDATGSQLPFGDTSKSDWAVQGQPVILTDGTDGTAAAIEATIQAVAPTSITIDKSPGTLGHRGSVLMPRVPIYLDPQQTFARLRTRAAEQWSINARAAAFGFQSDARQAFASLSVSTGALHDAVVQAVNPGAAGNALTLRFVADGAAGGSLTVAGSAYTYHYQASVTLVLSAIFALGGVFNFAGGFNPFGTLVAGDAIGPIALANGADKNWGTMGRGAVVATYDAHPVWDRGIQIADAANDSMQSLSELVDLGGRPIAIGTADASDWGRDVYITNSSVDEWQWLKAFIAAVRGRQVAFWLPTFRPDLEPLGFSLAVDSGGFPYLLVAGPDDESGGFNAWWPALRDRIQLVQADGTITYAQIAAAIDNGDGTLSLSLQRAFSGSPVVLVSWIDLCHFDSDALEISFDGATFSMRTTARAVLQ